MKTVGAPLRPRLFVACFPLLVALSHTVTPALLVGIERWEAMGTTLPVGLKKGQEGGVLLPVALPIGLENTQGGLLSSPEHQKWWGGSNTPHVSAMSHQRDQKKKKKKRGKEN